MVKVIYHYFQVTRIVQFGYNRYRYTLGELKVGSYRAAVSREFINHAPTVSISSSSGYLHSGDGATLTATASDPDRDISVDLNEYLHSSYINTENYVPDEGYIVHQHLRTKVIHAKYCASYYARSGITISVSKIVHLLSDFKPYRSWDKVNTDKLIIIPMFKEWLDVYDSFDKSLFLTISPIVEKNRSTIEKLAPLCKRMYNIK